MITQVSFNSIFAQQLESAALENSYGKATFFYGKMDDRKAFTKISDSPYQLGIEAGQNAEGSNTFAEDWRFFYGAINLKLKIIALYVWSSKKMTMIPLKLAVG